MANLYTEKPNLHTDFAAGVKVAFPYSILMYKLGSREPMGLGVKVGEAGCESSPIYTPLHNDPHFRLEKRNFNASPNVQHWDLTQAVKRVQW